MEKINFLDYIGRKINIGIGFVGGIITIGAALKEKPLSTIAIIVLLTICILLVLSLFQIFRDYRKLYTLNKEVEEKHNKLSIKYENLERQFNTQSELYSENIKELNLHKHVTHVVDVVVSSSTPKTNDAKQIIDLLRSSIEKKLKGSD